MFESFTSASPLVNAMAAIIVAAQFAGLMRKGYLKIAGKTSPVTEAQTRMYKTIKSLLSVSDNWKTGKDNEILTKDGVSVTAGPMISVASVTYCNDPKKGGTVTLQGQDITKFLTDGQKKKIAKRAKSVGDTLAESALAKEMLATMSKINS